MVALDPIRRNLYFPAAMKYYSWAVIFALVVTSLLSLAMLAGAESPFAPQPGVLVLKNGQTITGGLLREGDRYVVTLGPRGAHGELKVPVADIEVACRSLEEAYRFKLAAIRVPSVKPHIDLADWCLRNGLTDQASDEWVTALTIDAKDPAIVALDKRIKLALQPKVEKPAVAAAVVPVTQDEIDRALRAVSSDSTEQFASQIQPLLLNRCAVASCHGPGGTTAYRLIRPPARHANKTRETGRNLFASLAQLGEDGDSPLLTMATTPHGGSKEPVLTEHDRRQIELLTLWIQRTKIADDQKQPIAAKIDAQVRRATYVEDAPEQALPPANQLPKKNGKKEPQALPEKQPTSAERDPHSPDIFNERRREQK